MFKIISISIIIIMVVLFVYDYQLFTPDNKINIDGLQRVCEEMTSDIQCHVETIIRGIMDFIENITISIIANLN